MALTDYYQHYQATTDPTAFVVPTNATIIHLGASTATKLFDDGTTSAEIPDVQVGGGYLTINAINLRGYTLNFTGAGTAYIIIEKELVS